MVIIMAAISGDSFLIQISPLEGLSSELGSGSTIINSGTERSRKSKLSLEGLIKAFSSTKPHVIQFNTTGLETGEKPPEGNEVTKESLLIKVTPIVGVQDCNRDPPSGPSVNRAVLSLIKRIWSGIIALFRRIIPVNTPVPYSTHTSHDNNSIHIDKIIAFEEFILSSNANLVRCSERRAKTIKTQIQTRYDGLPAFFREKLAAQLQIDGTKRLNLDNMYKRLQLVQAVSHAYRELLEDVIS